MKQKENKKSGVNQKLKSAPINTDNHEGTLCLNQNGTTMFFTTCQSDKQKGT